MKKNVFVLCTILLYMVGYADAQNHKISLSAGANYNMIESLLVDSSVVPGNFFEPKIGGHIGGNYNIFFSDSSEFFISVSALLTYRALEEGLPPDFHIDNWTRYWFAMDLPLVVNFKVEPFLYLFAGINNRIKILANKKEGIFSNSEIQQYTAGITAGVKFNFAERFSVKCSYLRDITPFVKCCDNKVFYKLRCIDLSLEVAF